jgi:hypothetical protein
MLSMKPNQNSLKIHNVIFGRSNDFDCYLQHRKPWKWFHELGFVIHRLRFILTIKTTFFTRQIEFVPRTLEFCQSSRWPHVNTVSISAGISRFLNLFIFSAESL